MEICEAYPALIGTLSHVGNADHGLVTEVGFSQLWRKMYNMKIAAPGMTNGEWVERAKRGFAHSLARLAEFMPDFVLKHSDADGSIISEIERYEQTLTSQRKIPGSLFRQLGDVESHIMKPLLITAMVKAMMSAPMEFKPCLFSLQECTTQRFKAANMPSDIKVLCDYITSAQAYITAHIIPSKLTWLKGKEALDKLDIVFVLTKIGHNPISRQLPQGYQNQIQTSLRVHMNRKQTNAICI